MPSFQITSKKAHRTHKAFLYTGLCGVPAAQLPQSSVFPLKTVTVSSSSVSISNVFNKYCRTVCFSK